MLDILRGWSLPGETYSCEINGSTLLVPLVKTTLYFLVFMISGVQGRVSHMSKVTNNPWVIDTPIDRRG